MKTKYIPLPIILTKTKKYIMKTLNATAAQLAIDMVIMDAIERGHTDPNDLIRYMNTTTFEKAVKSYISMIGEAKAAILS